MNTLNTKNLKLHDTGFESKSKIYKLSPGTLAKEISPKIIELYQYMGLDFIDKYKSKLTYDIPEISHPIEMIEGAFDGYTMKYYKMKSLDSIVDDNLNGQRHSFDEMLKLYKKVEEVVKQASEKGIVFPDLRLKNILYNQNKIVFIDYDGIQLGKTDVVTSFSSLLGTYKEYINNDKYSGECYNFNTEFNKMSLLVMMFYLFFNISIKDVIDGETTVEELFDYLYIKDKPLMKKVKKIISADTEGEYLADDLIRLSSKYDLTYDDKDPVLTRKKMNWFWKK